MKYSYFITGAMFLSCCFIACKKEKYDFFYDNRQVDDMRSNSTTRIVNLGGVNQLILNNDTLTSYFIGTPIPGVVIKPPGTKYFPNGGSLGATFFIPKSFMNQGKANVKLENVGYQAVNDPLTFVAQEKYNTPIDYYILRGDAYQTGALPRVIEVPRDVTAPTKPGYFKIRLVNMALQYPRPGDAEPLVKPLSLALADGTLLSEKTSNIAPGQYSQYIEVPYGTYQFKVLTPAGTEVSALNPPSGEFADVIDPATSTITKGAQGIPHTVSTHLTFAPLKTFQPGGIYTIAVSLDNFTTPYYVGNPGETSSMWQNGFKIIADASEPENTTYSHIQAVNAATGLDKVTVKVNNTTVGNLEYSQVSEYSQFVYGQTKIDVQDAAGKSLTTKTLPLPANMNYTVWVYKTATGDVTFSLVQNTMDGGVYVGGGNGQDGSYTRRQYSYPFQKRWLNFCNDIPYASFTYDNGQPASTNNASKYLTPGFVTTDHPYSNSSVGEDPYQVLVYNSKPGVFPGTWLSQIAPLKSTDFIARKAAYTRGLPNQEPGIYTVALIGKLQGAGKESAKMIIVKHSK
ncbi:uncharacterized protein DUF4397 [Chitinophaga skermanii]|uniref:Uncharacterized protein DUF4397 n=1 Tax=Chitinophaga skermanii TaxID=331697 RepID=A0A327QVW7_9BACT|nr:DUF4397 domain-containing protein [Chitinophaga skermanii]RAJ08739.1 uncharacterized protein DUF4397 [Chitinophaga skermanii]